MQGPLLGLHSDNLRTQLQLVCFQVLSHFTYLDELYFCEYVVASGLLKLQILNLMFGVWAISLVNMSATVDILAFVSSTFPFSLF